MNTYSLLDSGENQKLEQIGKFQIIRPSQNSPYLKTKPHTWNNPDAIYHRNDKGGGHWQFVRHIPEEQIISYAGMKIKIKLTPFGHLGIFPEQKSNWDLIRSLGSGYSQEEVLNLFAYSGLSTIACLLAEMPVCHVDSSKGMVDWARENAMINNLENKKVRWIIEDVLKFVKREVKRKKIYKGFILDPPSFGRGSKGEVWKIEKHLPELMELLMQLCHSEPEFIILSCHTTGYSPIGLERLLRSMVKSEGQ
ncbi:MAG: class I SAM-dependent methyltransferase, partial [Leptospiraceae bacterium]|nr:class I SAM-dependent methyltransferase [Leptospiraceae bacterium]